MGNRIAVAYDPSVRFADTSPARIPRWGGTKCCQPGAAPCTPV